MTSPRRSASTSSSTRSARAAPARCTCLTTPIIAATSRSRSTIEEDETPIGRKVSRKMFFNEAHMVGMLQHPNIMPIYDAGEEDGKYYVVTEHIQGARTLGRLLPARQPVTCRRRRRDHLQVRQSPALRARPWRDPPRHQAEQRHADDRQRRTHHRLRHCDRQRLRGFPHRGHRRIAELHVARAGAVGRTDAAHRIFTLSAPSCTNC